MLSHKLSETEIAIRVIPKHLRWPEPDTSIAWTKAHACVDALQGLVRKVDHDCLDAEQNKELSVGAIRRSSANICDQALGNLVNFRPFEIAERAMMENVIALERLNERNREQVQMLEKLTKALADLREGIDATRRAVLERCKMRAGVSV